ncbi:MAG TPA: phosphoribosylformylglycinamidine synthase subunit PurL [Trueperaceae bacterium]
MSDVGVRESLRSQAAVFGLSEAEFDLVVECLGREPNALEAAMFGALWSEHCGYKNSRPLLKLLPTAGPQVLQGPGENAGVVDIGDGWALAFKMESHNHPSAVEPVQGAATGVGGILRDIFAMGARPVAVLDALRFGPLDGTEEGERNRWLLAGVVEGISHYGNAIGVPTVGGEIAFHPSYSQNPLVNVMAAGLMRHDALQSGTVGTPGNLLVYVGSRTGRDGLGGAVFASADLHVASEADRPAVQVGDPFMEKLLLEATLEAIERKLVVGVQDMGAAGLASSVGEMAHRAGLGVDLWIDRVPRREEGMTPLEVMLSESQERMVLTVEPERLDELLELLHHWELDAAVIGEVRAGGRLRILEEGEVAGDLPVAALNEAPTYRREGTEAVGIAEMRLRPVDVPLPGDLASVWLSLLSSPTIASKRPVFERYDHQVMTNTVVVPGAGDAAVLRIKGSRRGIALSVDCNARYVGLDPYEGARHAVAEAARNVACVGARPLAITNNLNFGNPTRPDVYYQLERSILGLRDACLALDTPVTGGNVSLYNQYRGESGSMVSVLPTPTVGMVGVLEDVTRHATLGFEEPDEAILLVGGLTGELGASEYLALIHGLEAGSPPRLDLELERLVQRGVVAAISAGLCTTAHDVAEGGLAVALAEMAIAGGVGFEVDLDPQGLVPEGEPRTDELLFGEAPSRILLAVPRDRADSVVAALLQEGAPVREIGRTGGEVAAIRVAGERLEVPVALLKEAFERPLEEALS